MNREQISSEVDAWIAEEELPTCLKPVKMYDSLYPGNDEEEREAYLDFMHWHLTKDWELLNLIPDNRNTDYFQNPISANEDSAFYTMDYRKKAGYSFSGYYLRLKKIYERIKDLAILHSSISHEEGRANIRQRYNNLVDDEFRTQRNEILDTLRKNPQLIDKGKALERLSELNIRISKAYSIWNQYADWK